MPSVEPFNLRRFELLAQGKAWCSTWARAAEEAVGRLVAAQQAGDNDGALIAALDSLSAVDRLVGWALTLADVCNDDDYRQRVRSFQERHAELRKARNLHEHLQGYLTEQRDRRADPRLTGAVVYRFADDGSFVLELLTVDGCADHVEVRLTDAVGDAFDLTWDTIKSADRAMSALAAPPGSEVIEPEYLHWIEIEDGSVTLSDVPPPGHEP